MSAILRTNLVVALEEFPIVFIQSKTSANPLTVSLSVGRNRVSCG